jgi:hypothetical protein
LGWLVQLEERRRDDREVGRLPACQTAISVVVEARWGSFSGCKPEPAGSWILSFRQTATEVVRNWRGLLLQGMAIEVVGRWSGSRQAKRSLRWPWKQGRNRIGVLILTCGVRNPEFH